MLLTFISAEKSVWAIHSEEIPVVFKGLLPHQAHSSSSIALSQQVPALNVFHSGENSDQANI